MQWRGDEGDEERKKCKRSAVIPKPSQQSPTQVRRQPIPGVYSRTANKFAQKTTSHNASQSQPTERHSGASTANQWSPSPQSKQLRTTTKLLGHIQHVRTGLWVLRGSRHLWFGFSSSSWLCSLLSLFSRRHGSSSSSSHTHASLSLSLSLSQTISNSRRIKQTFCQSIKVTQPGCCRGCLLVCLDERCFCLLWFACLLVVAVVVAGCFTKAKQARLFVRSVRFSIFFPTLQGFINRNTKNKKQPNFGFEIQLNKNIPCPV
jgi:hypothetical protein